MNISIRQAKKNDIPEILGLLYELGRPKPKNDSEVDLFRNSVKKQISEKDKDLLIAIRDDVNLVGLASIVFLDRLNRLGPELYIPELVVTGKYQQQGIGKKLIDACIAMASEKNCFRIRLESGNSRIASHKFYSKLGFESNSKFFSLTMKN